MRKSNMEKKKIQFITLIPLVAALILFISSLFMFYTTNFVPYRGYEMILQNNYFPVALSLLCFVTVGVVLLLRLRNIELFRKKFFDITLIVFGIIILSTPILMHYIFKYENTLGSFHMSPMSWGPGLTMNAVSCVLTSLLALSNAIILLVAKSKVNQKGE